MTRTLQALAVAAVFPLQFDGLFVEIQAHQCGLAPLPGEAGHLESQLHVVLDELLEHFVGHPLFALADFAGAALVETVAAVNVAVGAGWFYQ